MWTPDCYKNNMRTNAHHTHIHTNTMSLSNKTKLNQNLNKNICKMSTLTINYFKNTVFGLWDVSMVHVPMQRPAIRIDLLAPHCSVL